jgi:GGDEF domain-containing protein
MFYFKLLRRLVERKRPLTVYLNREAFQLAVTRHLKRKGVPVSANVVLHVRLSGYTSIRTHINAVAVWKLLRSTYSNLLKPSNAIMAVYLGDGAFAALISGVQPLEAELHARFLVYSITSTRIRRDGISIRSDAFAGLAIADESTDGTVLLTTAEKASLSAQEKGRKDSNKREDDELYRAIEDRFIPFCQIIPGFSLDVVAPNTAFLH